MPYVSCSIAVQHYAIGNHAALCNMRLTMCGCVAGGCMAEAHVAATPVFQAPGATEGTLDPSVLAALAPRVSAYLETLDPFQLLTPPGLETALLGCMLLLLHGRCLG